MYKLTNQEFTRSNVCGSTIPCVSEICDQQNRILNSVHILIVLSVWILITRKVVKPDLNNELTEYSDDSKTNAIETG